MELHPRLGWETFDRPVSILDLLHAQLVPEDWHIRRTAESVEWDCRHDLGCHVAVELRGGTLARLALDQPGERARESEFEDTAPSAWARGLGGLTSVLIQDFGLVPVVPMSEDEWATCAPPGRMLQFLHFHRDPPRRRGMRACRVHSLPSTKPTTQWSHGHPVSGFGLP
jgi:hypothetical protein